MTNEQKIIEVLEKLHMICDTLYLATNFNDNFDKFYVGDGLKQSSDLITELKLSVSPSDTSMQQSQ